MSNLRIVFQNETEQGGLFTTPVWFGLHDGNFDLFNVGEAASQAVERIAEDGEFEQVNEDFAAEQSNGITGVVFGADGLQGPPVIDPGETASTIVENVDSTNNAYLTYAAMILPSNDAFFGSSTAIRLFDDNGSFLGAQNVSVMGTNIYDSSTEVNNEFDAVFQDPINSPGVAETGVIARHEGFIGSVGNPLEAGEEAIILGSDNTFGFLTDTVAGDFTIDNYKVGTLHVNEVAIRAGTAQNDQIDGGDADDIVTAGAGDDTVNGGNGWDVLDGGEGADNLNGGAGNDLLTGGSGNDNLNGGAGNDTVIYAGTAGDYRFVRNDDGSIRVENSTFGTDTLRDIENVKFSGETRYFTVDELLETDSVDLHTNIAGETQTIDGGDGRDAFVINGSENDYGIDVTADGGFVVWTGQDFDILFNFEEIRFNDATYSLGSNGEIEKIDGSDNVDLHTNIAGEIQTIDGGDGRDAFVIDGSENDYGIDVTADGGFVVWTGQDFDILFNFEQIRFNDATYALNSDGGIAKLSHASAVMNASDNGLAGMDSATTALSEDDADFVYDTEAVDYDMQQTVMMDEFAL